MELWNACLVAFGVVFTLLTFLALAMSVLTTLFPERKQEAPARDAAVYAAIASVVAATIPGSRVTHVEENQ